jgi:elongation factor G
LAAAFFLRSRREAASMKRQIDNLRNIGIIAHIDAGKTTVTERMLFYSGAKHRVGMVDMGTTETDCDPEEQDRGITIYSACVTFDWKNVHVNLLDTPGHVDFTAEVERCLRVLDGAVVVFSAREGVEAQSETVWRQADRYRVPRVAFINKMDREGADFEATLEEIHQRLHGNPVAVQIPIGAGPTHTNTPFRGVVDLIDMKLLVFDAQSEGRNIEIQDIPADCLDLAHLWREAMLERLYSHSDQLMELALQEHEIPADLIRRVIRDATIHLQIQPVLCGSALHGIGVQPVLDAVADFLPSPLDVPPVQGISMKKKDATEFRKPSADEPFCGLVFKVLPARTGDLSWVRIYSGELKPNSRVLNPGKDKKENVAQLWRIHATKREEQVDKGESGDIVAIVGLRHSVTGDTVCDTREPVLLEAIKFPETVISMAIEPESATERDKLAATLEMLKRQDPTVQIASGETGQTLISGMGELHLEVIKNRLLRDFNLKVKFHKPQVSYRETIEQAVEVWGECHRHLGGQQLFARLHVRLEPLPGDASTVIVLNQCPPDSLPIELLDAALEELRANAHGGGQIAGYPLMKLKVTVIGGESHHDSSNETAFRIAANDAFHKGLEQGRPVLLEPIMKLNITTPQDYLGEFVGDLQQRRALIARTDSRGTISVIEAHAPLKELFGYSSAMRSLSQGRAGCSMEPLRYAPAPPDIAKNYLM